MLINIGSIYFFIFILIFDKYYDIPDIIEKYIHINKSMNVYKGNISYYIV